MDHIRDTNYTQLVRISSEVPLPDFVKEATVCTEAELRDLSPREFADPSNRLFPVHTKADTWLSAAYFEKFAREAYPQDKQDQLENKLRVMCSFWKVAYPKWEEKEASEDGYEIPYYVDGALATTVRVTSPEMLIKLANHHVQQQAQLPWLTRRDVARSILGAATKTGVALKESVEVGLQKMAAYGVGTVEDAARIIGSRRDAELKIYGNHEISDSMFDIVKTASQDGLVPAEVLDGVAGALDVLDKTARLEVRYGLGMSPPEDMFTFTEFVARMLDKEAVALSNGCVVPATILARSEVREFMGGFLGETVSVNCAKEAAQKLNERAATKLQIFIDKQYHRG